MEKLIRIFVHDKDGVGISGTKVTISSELDNCVTTDRNGMACPVLNTGESLQIFVGDNKCYDGRISDAPDFFNVLI